MRAVRFEQSGGPDVLEVVDVERPSATPGRVAVGIRAAGINPGEIGFAKATCTSASLDVPLRRRQ